MSISEKRQQLSNQRMACWTDDCERPRLPGHDLCGPCLQITRASSDLYVAQISAMIREDPSISTFKPAPVQAWEKNPS